MTTPLLQSSELPISKLYEMINSEPPNTKPLTNNKKRKAKAIVSTDLWEESRDPHGKWAGKEYS